MAMHTQRQHDSSVSHRMPPIHVTDVYRDKGHISCMFILKGGRNLLFYVGEVWERSQIHDGEVVNYKYLQMFIQVPRSSTLLKKWGRKQQMQIQPESVSGRDILMQLIWMIAEPRTSP